MIQLPDNLINEIKNYIIFKPKTKEELKNAIKIWCKNKDKTLNEYGHISNWDTSLINDMSFLFEYQPNFNDNINYWDVSNVTNMKCMFHL